MHARTTMAYYVYKCNARGPEYARASGDWCEVFDAGGIQPWGLSTLKGVDQLDVGDLLLAYQTDRNELVGVARVVRWDPEDGARRVVVEPIEPIGVKVRPLRSDPRIATIQAFKPGDIRTAYRISAVDAKLVLDAARQATRERRPAVLATQHDELIDAFADLPTRERRAVLRWIKVVARASALRPKVLRLWPSRCAACGLEIVDHDGNAECEVAHIKDVHAAGLDLIGNGLPLCRTHHWAFDRGLWAIHPTKLTIEVARRSRKHLGDIHGKVIVRPSSIKGIAALGREYLEWRWAQFQRRGR